MFKNYFYLLRSAAELNSILKDKTIRDIFSQEKNVLFFDIAEEETPHQHLIISANQNLPYIFIKQTHHKAKKNLIEFYNDYLPAKIISVTISTKDRIIKISTDKFSLYFFIRGNNTNIFLEDNNKNYFPFTKSNLNINELLLNETFTATLNFSFTDKTFSTIEELKKTYPQLSAEIKEEIKIRTVNNPSKTVKEIFETIVNEILQNDICVKYIPELRKTKFYPVTFQLFSFAECEKSFTSFNTAFAEYLRSYYGNKKKNELSSALKKYFSANLNKLSAKMNNLKARIEKGSQESKYRNYANLLQMNRNLLKKGMDKIELTDYTTNKTVIIKIDPKLSVNKNIDRYFEKASDEKINYNKSLDLFNFTKEKYYSLLSLNEEFEKATTTDALEKLHKKLIVKKKDNIIKMETGKKFKYWHYLIDDKYNVYIGRDSKSNDYLSLKFAKQNDYWFHARGLPGSHVVLRVENTKESIPKDVLKKAASLAAHYSKAKTAGTAPVSYTFAKFVHKKKGMLPGKVLLSKENTLLVKPGIPKNCILQNEQNET